MKLNAVLQSLFFVFICLVFTNCSSVRVTTNAAVGVTNEDAQEEFSKTIWTVLGQEKTWDIQKCNSGALAVVKVNSNLLFAIIQVSTIGILRPVKVVCTCNEEPK